MRDYLKAIAAGVICLFALGFTAASADDDNYRRDSYRPDLCEVDHDHRSHQANYYDYYAKDKYFRAGPYRSGARLSVTIGGNGYGRRGYDRRNDDHRYNNRRGSDRRYNDRRGYNDRRYNSRRSSRGHGNRVVHRDVLQTRYRARIVVVEEVRYDHGQKRRVCTVSVRGPEARYVPYRRLQRAANRHCSRYARVKIYA